MKHVAPAFKLNGFHCPHPECGVYAKQHWTVTFWVHPDSSHTYTGIPDLEAAICDHCKNFSLWRKSDLLYPAPRTAPPPHPEMPATILPDYQEAQAVYDQSPRSSSALLRLVIQKLCVALQQPGKNLNADIGELVKQGLPIQVQRSLDIVRVVGNNQVHPGVLDVRDDPSMARLLFDLVNFIVEDRIARPKQIDAIYDKLPEGARKQIEERDKPPLA